ARLDGPSRPPDVDLCSAFLDWSLEVPVAPSRPGHTVRAATSVTPTTTASPARLSNRALCRRRGAADRTFVGSFGGLAVRTPVPFQVLATAAVVETGRGACMRPLFMAGGTGAPGNAARAAISSSAEA